jgi:hypothetical protein
MVQIKVCMICTERLVCIWYMLGIAPSRRWVDPKVERRSNEDTKHQRAHQGLASEGDALIFGVLRAARRWRTRKGEVSRSLSKVIAEDHRTLQNSEVSTTTRGHALGSHDENLRVQGTTQERRTMKAAPHGAGRAPLPKVSEGPLKVKKHVIRVGVFKSDCPT